MNLHQQNDENTAIFNRPKRSGEKAGTSMVGDPLEKREAVHKYASAKAMQRGEPTA